MNKLIITKKLSVEQRAKERGGEKKRKTRRKRERQGEKDLPDFVSTFWDGAASSSFSTFKMDKENGRIRLNIEKGYINNKQMYRTDCIEMLAHYNEFFVTFRLLPAVTSNILQA